MKRFAFLLKYTALSFYTKSTGIFILLTLLLTGLVAWALPQANLEKEKEKAKVSFSVVDEDNSFLSRLLIDQVRQLPAIRHVYPESLAQAQQRLKKGEILLAVVIPKGFLDDIVYQEKGQALRIYLNEKMPGEADFFVRLFRHASGSIAAVQTSVYAWQEFLLPLELSAQRNQKESEGAAAALMIQLLGRGSIVKINGEGRFDSLRFVVSVLTLLMAMLPGLLVLMAEQQERLSGVHEVLDLCALPWWQVQGARILVCSLWTGISATPLFLLLKRFFPQLDPVPFWGTLMLILLCSCFLCSGLSSLNLGEDLALMTGWLLILSMVLLGGGIYPRALMPLWMQPLSALSPFRWGLESLYANFHGREIPGFAMILLGIQTALAAVINYARERRSS